MLNKLTEMSDPSQTYVLAIEDPSDQVQQCCLERALATRRDKQVLVVECQATDMPILLAKMVGQRFLLAPLEPTFEDGGMRNERQQALYNYFSRRAHPAWWRSVDWFKEHRHEFKAGEHVVIRDAQVLHRTRDEKEHLLFLSQHGNRDTLAHTMDEDGKERKYHL